MKGLKVVEGIEERYRNSVFSAQGSRTGERRHRDSRCWRRQSAGTLAVCFIMRALEPSVPLPMFRLFERRSRRDCCLIRSLMAASVFIIGSCAFVSPRAEGSCGDWLEGHVDMTGADQVSQGHADAVEQPAARPPKKPCNGASCGRAPSFPLLPTDAPTIPLDLERDAVMQAWSIASPAGLRLTKAVEDSFFSATLADRLERPPRRS